MNDDRPARYIEDDKVIYRASAFGSCERMLVATSQKYVPHPHPDWFQEVLDEGSHMEPIINGMWEIMSGVDTTFAQQEVELEIGEINGRMVVVRGHIDGQAGLDKAIREFKKVRETQWDRFLKSGVEYLPQYPWQVSVYMHAMDGWELELVGGRMVADEDGKKGITDVVCHRLEEPPLPMKAIFKRALRLEGLINDGFDAREVACNVTMFPCPFFDIHDVPDVPEYEIPVEGDAATLARTYIETWVNADHHIKRLKKQLDSHEKAKKQATKVIQGALNVLGDEAVAAKKVLTEEWEFTRTRTHVKEAVRKAYDMDYFTAKAVDDGKEQEDE